MEVIKVLFSSITLGAAFRLGAPLMLGVAGFCFSNASGILNIALESFMTFGAFFSLLGSYLFGDPWIGLMFGVLAGLLFSAMYGLFNFELGANGLITGVGFNMSAWGLTTMLLVAIFNTRGATNVGAEAFPAINMAFLEGNNFLNEIFNNQTILVYTAPLFCIAAFIVMYKTPFGLQVRMVGQNPGAAETAGVSVRKYRWICMLISGIFMGLAGAYMSLNSLAMFTENMIAGRGFLVMASVLVAKAHPLKAMLIALLFSYSQALTLTFSGFNVYNQIISMIPYVAVILVLFVTHFKNIKTAGEIYN